MYISKVKTRLILYSDFHFQLSSKIRSIRRLLENEVLIKAVADKDELLV